MTTYRWALTAALAAGVLAPAAVHAQAAAPRTETLQFPKGATGTTVRGQIRGEASVTYLLGARAGQTLSLRLDSANGAANVNVFAPGADTALFNSSVSGGSFTGPLPVDGAYRLDVYLMRSAARRNETAAYTLAVSVTGRPREAGADAKVAGTRYNATAEIGCAVGAGAPLGRCPAGVLRFPGGEATVEVTLPGGGKRHIYFQGARATGSDSPRGAFSAAKSGDLNRIAVGDAERYEFPDAFVLGG